MMEFTLIINETNFKEAKNLLFLEIKVMEYKKYISLIYIHACGNIMT